MKKLFVFFFTLVLLLITVSCRNRTQIEVEQTKQLDIYYPVELESSSVIRALCDYGIQLLMEKETGFKPVLHVIESGRSVDEFVLSGINGLLITEHPSIVVPYSAINKLTQLNGIFSQDDVYVSIKGKQYGYVFNSQCPKQPILIADASALERFGLENLPFTEEGVRNLLSVLSKEFRCPMVVYGNPISSSYELFLSLFSMASSDSLDFFCETDGKGNPIYSTSSYDKISDSACDYLSFMAELYKEGLLSDDMFYLSEYSAANMLIRQASVMAVISDPKLAEQTVIKMKEQGRSPVRIVLPNENLYMSDKSRQLTGFISNMNLTTDEIRLIFQKIDGYSIGFDEPKYPTLDDYCLFDLSAYEGSDYLRFEVKDIYTLFMKERLDEDVISPTFIKIISGENSISSFNDMVQQWLTKPATNYDSFDGSVILEMLGSP